MEYVRRTRGVRVHGLTHPLLTTTSGEKFGKSAANGTLWLDPTRTSPFSLYQFFVNTADADIVRFLKLFTFLTLEEIDALAFRHEVHREARTAQHALALEVVCLVHGEAAARTAQKASEILFGEKRGRLGEDLVSVLRQEVPTTTVSGRHLLTDLLVRAGLVPSLNQARALIQGGGVCVNNEGIADPRATISVDEADNGAVLVRVGKKRHHLFMSNS